MNLPQHIIDSIERRWATKLQQEVEAWRQRKRTQQARERSRSTRAALSPKENARRYNIGSDFAA